MNEKSKSLMTKQKNDIVEGLKNHFALPVFEDEIAEDEEATFDEYNCFVFETSEFKPTTDIRKLSQNIYAYYYSENRDDVDEKTIDIISILIAVKGVSFSGSRKERLQLKDTDRFVDRITLTFTRTVPIEFQV